MAAGQLCFDRGEFGGKRLMLLGTVVEVWSAPDMIIHDDSHLLLRAISFAARAHQCQQRKDQVTPYVAHPMRVLTVLATIFHVKDAETLATAVLHDTIEDTNTDYDDLLRHFGQRVADHVALLSKDNRLPEADRERAYFAALAGAPCEVKLCKLGDTYDNLIDAEFLPAAARSKAVRKARELVGLFADSLPETWQHVVPIVQQRIDAAASGLDVD
jgi:guanosine-3',5'-bis(diphosphate) 3'-pyrophosphohydrolase